MPCRLQAVAFDAYDPIRLAGFWADLLGRTVVEDHGGALLPGSDTQVGLRFSPGRPGDRSLRRLHLHVLDLTAAGQEETVERAQELGAVHVDVGQLPEERHVVLADPEGNRFCVIEPGNSFLAGCGPLAEVACEGTRAVGLFWAEALGWPLVWDESQETAVQSPQGGTKVSWGGPPLTAKLGRNQQRLDLALAPGDQVDEVERLVRLGATRIAACGGAVELADPDGNEFLLLDHD